MHTGGDTQAVSWKEAQWAIILRWLGGHKSGNADGPMKKCETTDVTLPDATCLPSPTSAGLLPVHLLHLFFPQIQDTWGRVIWEKTVAQKHLFGWPSCTFVPNKATLGKGLPLKMQGYL